MIEGKGLVVYPGFIDLYTTSGQAAGAIKSLTGAGRTVNYADYALPRTPPDNRNGITPEFEVATRRSTCPTPRPTSGGSSASPTSWSPPAAPIATGQSALVEHQRPAPPRVDRQGAGRAPHRPAEPRRRVRRGHSHDRRARTADTVGPCPDPTQAPARRSPRPPGPRRPSPRPGTPPGRRAAAAATAAYPTSLMGVVAHLRQAMLDAENHHERLAYYEEKGGPRPAERPGARRPPRRPDEGAPGLVGGEHPRRDPPGARPGRGVRHDAVIVGGREAGKVADRLKAKDVPVVLRLDFPEEPKVPTEAEYRKTPDRGARGPAQGPGRPKPRGGRSGSPCAKPSPPAGVRFAFATEGIGNRPTTFPAQVRKAIAAGLSKDAALDALTRRAAEIAGLGKRLGTIEKGKLGHLVVMTAPFGDENAKVRYVLADGIKFDMEKTTAAAAKGKGQAGDGGEFAKGKGGAGGRGQGLAARTTPTTRPRRTSQEGRGQEGGETKKDEPRRTSRKDEAEAGRGRQGRRPKRRPRREDDQPPKTPFVDVASELDADRKPTIKTGGNVLIKDATILTVTRGTIPKGSILVKDGKIAAVGAERRRPPRASRSSTPTGLVAMPGIIDTHSHMAMSGRASTR